MKKIYFKDAFTRALIVMALSMILLFQGCAHSEAQRTAASNVDSGYISLENNINNSANGSISNAYQNTSQTTKGVLIGGLSGAALGTITSGVGTAVGAAGGVIVGGAIGSYLDHYTTSSDKLKNRQAKVFVLGDQILIVVPSEHLFVDRTATILPSADSTLNLVASYINQHRNMSVVVTAYTDATYPVNVSRSLTQEQANSVVKYLWRQGVNTRLISAVGGDSCHLVSPPLSGGCGENNRVEIRFEKLPPC